MVFELKIWQWVHHLCGRPKLLATLTLFAIFTTPYIISENLIDLNRYQIFFSKNLNESEALSTVIEIPKGFLVSNPKCQILERNPWDPSILKFVKKEKFEACTDSKLLTRIVRKSNGQLILKIDPNTAKNYVELFCSWAPVYRPKPTKTPHRKIDSEVSRGNFTDFMNEVILPENVDIIVVKCEAKKVKFKTKKGKNTVYENVHPVMRLKKVEEIIDKSKMSNGSRKLSVLIIGIDNVSRMNFERSMFKTANYLKETGWTELKGYNKMGDNTFPNLMAILTGMNLTRAYSVCKPTQLFGLDNCSLIWQAFRNASYVTAYGEDTTSISTFDYMKVGFVYPPTDFYLRPYLIAAEKYLALKRHLNNKYYCTGPEPSSSRILNYAVDFAKTFIGVPYFGFFWTNAVSHDDMNGLFSVDEHVMKIFQQLEHEEVLNDTMVIFLSDHGSRYGPFRETDQGWYEERLPFNYIWLPEWFKKENPSSFDALRENGRRLTSPFDVHETLRDILIRAGGEVEHSEGCPRCQSLFNTTPRERGCEDVGVSHQWCACTAFGNGSINSKVALEAAHKMVDQVESIAKIYKDSEGKRLCASVKLNKVLKIHEILDVGTSNGDSYDKQFLCQIQITPGNGKFEARIGYNEDGNLTIVNNQISRLDTYEKTAKCLKVGQKQYCFCT